MYGPEKTEIRWTSKAAITYKLLYESDFIIVREVVNESQTVLYGPEL